MSAVLGKNGRNIRKLQVSESTIPAVGFKNVRALHEAAEGDTTIDLTSLTTPAQATANGFVNPSLADLTAVNLKQYKDNVVVRTGTGQLIQDIDYVINGATTIKLSVPALDAQVFEIVIDAAPRTGTIIADARPLVATGVLAAGDTDFNVGEPFKVGVNPSKQVGEVMVFMDSQQMWRNVGNQPDGEGDYYEVHAGAGLGTIIRFNTPDLVNDRQILVVSVGALAEKPDGSLTALVETLQGQVDTHREYIEALAGETVAPGAPNNVDLKAFGDRVIDLEKILDQELELSRSVFIKEVRSSGVASSSTPGNGVYSTYTLNTLEGDLTFASLSSNQITLPEGRYILSGQIAVGFPPVSSSPAVKARFRNVTDSSDAVISVLETNGRGPDTGDGQGGVINISGYFEIPSSKTFELQWRSSAAFLVYGAASFGDSEVYASIKITKVEKKTIREWLGL